MFSGISLLNSIRDELASNMNGLSLRFRNKDPLGMDARKSSIVGHTLCERELPGLYCS